VSEQHEPARRFAELWQQGDPPELSRFLEQTGPLTPAQVAAVLCVDLRERWRRHERLPAEDYLARFPQVQAEREAALDLVYCEILARADAGEAPSAAAYAARFPDLAAELGRQIEMHHLLEADATSIRPLAPSSAPTGLRSILSDALDRTGAPATSVDAGRAPLAWALDGLLPPPCLPGYEIGAPLGRGGMGVVYLARQLQLNRQVALKMIRAGSLAASGDVARFLSEAEAVAALQHRNIVQVFEVGRHEGLPFMALEYVAGGSLANKLQKGPLVPKEAAWLVEQLARGLNAAHQAGIVHRDLKPGNVLLSFPGEGREAPERNTGDKRPSLGDCVPKITDFGLAKRFESVHSGATSSEALTQTGIIVGTPNYMAPEQAQGHSKHVGPAADIFALGAVLYECLTGQPPFQADTALETLKRVVEQEPVPPRQLQPRVPHDLQTICLKCLRKQPQHRYASADALAEDLRRWQAHEPIQARPVGRLERTAKWVRRRPAAAALVAASVLLLLAGLGAGFWYQHWHIWWAGEQARQETELNARHTYLNQEVAAAVHEAGQERQKLHACLHDPLQVHVLLSDLTKWQQVLDRARAALTRAQKLADGEPDLLDPTLGGRLQTLNAQLAADRQAYQLADKLDAIRLEAYTWTEEKFHTKAAGPRYAAAFQEAGLGVDQGTTAELAAKIRQSPARYALVAALDFWADVAADATLQQHLLAVARLANPDPWRDQVRDPKNRRDSKALEPLAARADVARQSPQILVVLVNLLVKSRGDPKPLLRKAVLAHPQDFWLFFTLGTNSKDPVERIGYYQTALAIRPLNTAALNDLGVALHDNKDVAGAIACFQKALAIDPKHAHALDNLGSALKDQGNLDQAITCFKEALKINPQYVLAHNNLGTALQARKDVDGAIACYEKALKIAPNFAQAHGNLGLALFSKGELKGAVAHCNQALKINPQVVQAHNGLGLVLWKKGDLQGAIDCFNQALKIAPNYAEAQANVGGVWLVKKNVEEAIACYKKALKIDPRLAPAHYGLGQALKSKNDLDGAIDCYKLAVAIDPMFAEAHNNLGNALRQKKDLKGAIDCFQKALAINPKLAPAQFNLGLCLEDQGDRDKAIEHYQQAVANDPTFAMAYGVLGRALLQQGRFAEARQATATALQLLPPGQPLHDPYQKQLVQCEQLLVLDQKLTAIQKGQVQPADAAEQLALADLCRTYKKQYAAAVTFYAGAFAAAPSLQKSNRFQAACTAVLASAGQGRDVDLPDTAARAKLRQQGLDWLRADLELWRQQAASKKPKELQDLIKQLSHWQTAPELTWVRDAQALAQLTETERQPWQQLWAEVAELIHKTKK
jgi:serine/threonine-protein kinase